MKVAFLGAFCKIDLTILLNRKINRKIYLSQNKKRKDVFDKWKNTQVRLKKLSTIGAKW